LRDRLPGNTNPIMNKHSLILPSLLGLVALAGCKTQTPAKAAPVSSKDQQSTYVIVPGA
jgi:hypothetical protein